MSLIQAAIAVLTIIGTALLTTLFNRKQERNRVRRPIAMEMENITSHCRTWHENIEDIESTDAKTKDDAWAYTPPKNLSYGTYKENKSKLGILTKKEIEHIEKYYERVEELHYRMENGTDKRDHVRTLTEQIMREHDKIYVYMANGTFYRLKMKVLSYIEVDV